MIRTAIVTLFAVAVAVAACGSVQAQSFPTRPVTLIIPWPAGGATDVQLRALATATEKHLGQHIMIENRPGAAATLGPIHMASTAQPDGYTVSQIPIAVFRAPFLRKMSFDPSQDLTYIIHLSAYTFGVVVRNDAPWRSFAEFLAAAGANPGMISYGSSGVGGTPHITMEEIARRLGIKWTHVPFKGVAETVNALLGGYIQAAADGSGWAPQVDAGQFRLLVTWGATRSKNWPDVPTLKEIGIDLVSNSPFGIAGPKGMDPRIVRTLHDAFKKGQEDPLYLAAMAALGQEPSYLNSEDYRAFAIREIAEQRRLIETLGLRQN
jgi:tripartite-type tricarboxylate transporter receptor subunit TctC